MRRLAHIRDHQGGAAAAEMALIVPLVLALIFAMFEGGYYMWSEHKVVKGVRDAARYAGRLDFSKYTCPSTIDATARDQIKNLTRTGQLSGGTAKVPGWVDSDVTVAVTCASGTGGIYGVVGGNAPRVKVSALVVYPSLMGSLGFTSASINLRAEAESPVMGL
jgi:Flp pilus assembly protein TadG